MPLKVEDGALAIFLADQFSGVDLRLTSMGRDCGFWVWSGANGCHERCSEVELREELGEDTGAFVISMIRKDVTASDILKSLKS